MPFKDIVRTRTVVEEYEMSILEFHDTNRMYRDSYAGATIQARPALPNEVPHEEEGYALELDVWEPNINDDRRIQVRAFFSLDDLEMFAQELASYARLQRLGLAFDKDNALKEAVG